jgi:tetratricopeptide (TPR) repeat protein
LDLENPVIKLCLEGTRAEFQGRVEEARALYQKAWEARRDDYEACVAAHYVARFQTKPEDILFWNQESLNCAKRVNDDRVKEFYPSLYLNLGRSYELLGNQPEAQRYYDLAAELGVTHRSNPWH